MALIAAGLWLVATLLGHLAFEVENPSDPRSTQLHTSDAVVAVTIVASLMLFFYLRIDNRNPARVVNLGLAYMVIMAFAIGLVMHGGPPSEQIVDASPMITWTGPMILIFAAIVPAQPWKMLLAGSLAASMDPLGMVIGRATGHYDFGPLSNTLIMHYPTYLLLGVAVVISRIFTGLGQQVSKAQEMGSYRLNELLGRGGMGEVYRATHRMLARPAAIKLIRPEVLAERSGDVAQLAIARFYREAEAAANLRSPNTVALYDFGVTEDGTLYFVMELLNGMDLQTLVRQEGPLPARRVIHILRQICESLEEAHASGLVHRDIKPANIHVGRVGLHDDFVKVLDFGLVKSVGRAASGEFLATAAGVMPGGTPAYMAPEVALGELVDGRADLYALGCVGYYLLTGRLVFEAETALAMIAKHIREVPIPPSQRSEIPVDPALDRLIVACLEKNPGDRPKDASELERLLAAVEIEPWSEEEATRWWTMHQPA